MNGLWAILTTRRCTPTKELEKKIIQLNKLRTRWHLLNKTTDCRLHFSPNLVRRLLACGRLHDLITDSHEYGGTAFRQTETRQTIHLYNVFNYLRNERGDSALTSTSCTASHTSTRTLAAVARPGIGARSRTCALTAKTSRVVSSVVETISLMTSR